MKITKMILLIVVIGLQLSGLSSYAQKKLLKIGDKVPDFQLSEFLFYSNPSMKISDFKGKLLILDYWTVGCVPCIKAMPKYDKLQKLFGDRIAIIPIVSKKKDVPVTNTEFEEAKQYYTTFWKKNKYTNQTSLPTIIDSTGLRSNFTESTGVPYEVWINGDGILVGLTGSDELNEKEIRSVLSGSFVNSPGVSSLLYNSKEPLLKSNDAQETKFSNYIAFTPYWHVQTQGLHYEYDSLKNTSRLTGINLSLNAVILPGDFLFEDGESFGNNTNRIVYNVADSNRYFEPDNEYPEVWNKKHTYCYEAVNDGKVSKEIMVKNMREYFQNHFGIQTGFQKQVIECLALIRTSNDNMLLLSNRKEDLGKRVGLTYPEKTIYAEDVKIVTSIFKSTSELVTHMNYSNYYPFKTNPLLIVDETGSIDNIRLVFNVDIKEGAQDIRSFGAARLKKQLKQYGLDLVPVKRDMEVFVITEKDYKPKPK
jgi:thiol-disulfide isomerase/thioredoxin